MTDPKISALYVAVQEVRNFLKFTRFSSEKKHLIFQINSLIQNGTSCSRSLEEKIVEHLENSQLLGKLPKNNGDSHEEVGNITQTQNFCRSRHDTVICKGLCAFKE